MRDKKNKALNSDLWELLIDQCDYHLSVKFKWVKGHKGHPENEECDLLAKEAAMSSDLKIDEIFELKVRMNKLSHLDRWISKYGISEKNITIGLPICVCVVFSEKAYQLVKKIRLKNNVLNIAKIAAISASKTHI